METLKAEILTAIRYAVLGGFYNQEEILENIQDIYYDEELDESWIRMEIDRSFSERLAEQQSWPAITDFDRLEAAFDKLNDLGIIAMHNAGYTRQDGESDAYDMHHTLAGDNIPTKGYCFYHGQDLERVIESGKLYLAFGYFQGDDHTGMEIGRSIVQALEEASFQVSWNQQLDTRIEVNGINWQKRLEEA